MKTALLVDTSFAAVPIARALHDCGYRVLTVGARPTDALGASHVHYIQMDYARIADLERVIVDNSIDVLVPGCNDVSYAVCCQLANRLGYKGFEAEAALQSLDKKDKFRDLCKGLNISAPLTYPNEEAALQAPGKLIVKPVDSYSGKGISVLETPTRSALAEALLIARQETKLGRVVIEDYVEGQLYSYSAFLEEGKVKTAFNVVEYGTVNPFVVDTSYVLDHHGLESSLQQCTEILARALEIRQGLLHLQYIAQGADFWLIEPARRCPGDLYGELINRATGYPYAQAYVSAFTGTAVPAKAPGLQEYTVRHTLTSRQAGILDFVAFENASALTGWYPIAPVGMPLAPSPGGRVAITFFSARDEASRNMIVEKLKSSQMFDLHVRATQRDD